MHTSFLIIIIAIITVIALLIITRHAQGLWGGTPAPKATPTPL